MLKLFVLLSTLLLPLVAIATPLQIIVSIPPQKHFVERIGQENVNVTVMVPPGQSLETYEPTPKQMTLLSTADIYLSISVLPFEKVWMERMQQANPQMQVVKTDTLLPLRNWTPNEVKGKHEHLGIDPHVWLDPLLVKTMALAIQDALIERDPVHQEQYRHHYQTFIIELEQLHQRLEKIFAPLKSRSFLIFHPEFGYFAETYQLEQIAIETEGKEPNAKAMARLIERAKREHIYTVFVQKQFSSTSAQAVAQAIKGHIIEIDPLAENYVENLLHIANLFAQAMQQ